MYMYDFSYLCKFWLKTCCLLPIFLNSLKIKIEQNSLISLIYFNNLLSFYLTMTRVDGHDKMLKTTFLKYIIYDKHNPTLWHTYHIMHTHTTLYTHNSHSESPRYTRFWHTTKLKMKLKFSDPLLLATTTVCLYNFSNLNLNLVPPSTYFRPHDLHNRQKSNSLVSPVISSEYVQVLCAEMPSVVNHFLLATSWFFKRNPKPEIQISKFENFYLPPFPVWSLNKPPPAIYL